MFASRAAWCSASSGTWSRSLKGAHRQAAQRVEADVEDQREGDGQGAPEQPDEHRPAQFGRVVLEPALQHDVRREPEQEEARQGKDQAADDVPQWVSVEFNGLVPRRDEFQ
jgi:hypothetical protein